MAAKRMTLTARRKRIREIRLALSLALTYTEPHMRDMERSDHMLGYAAVLTDNLVNDAAKDTVSGTLLRARRNQ
jgi:hypothetical protein